VTARAAGRRRPARSWATAGLAASLLRFALSAVLLTTGGAKALDLPGFAAIVAEYRALPATVVVPVAPSESALGAWLLAGVRTRLAALASAALHATYAALTGAALARGPSLENCGCLGVFWGRPLASSTLGEDAALVTLSLALATLAARARP
jgi:uncharacterized membrane protein YphA (DoxX/SURF4 family)